MSDVNLLLFGCAVSFISAAGAYVYIRESFTSQAKPVEQEERRPEPRRQRLRDVA